MGATRDEPTTGVSAARELGAFASSASVEADWYDANDVGVRQLKHAAWGDGHDRTRVEASDGGLTVWYGRDGEYVGVLTHDRDGDLETGIDLIRSRSPLE